MHRFKITYLDENTEPEEVNAHGFRDNGVWIDFYTVGSAGGTDTVLRVRSDAVKRVEQVGL